MTATAVVGLSATATAASPGTAVSGTHKVASQVVKQAFTVSNDPDRGGPVRGSGTVRCPAGTVLTGGGAGTPRGRVPLTVSAPTDDGQGWTATYDSGLTEWDANTRIAATVYAVCQSS